METHDLIQFYLLAYQWTKFEKKSKDFGRISLKLEGYFVMHNKWLYGCLKSRSNSDILIVSFTVATEREFSIEKVFSFEFLGIDYFQCFIHRDEAVLRNTCANRILVNKSTKYK